MAVLFTAEEIVEIFHEIGREIAGASANARNDAAKEALNELSSIFSYRVDYPFRLMQAEERARKLKYGEEKSE